jgi:hypothetical protein
MRHELPPTAVEIIIAEDLKGIDLANYLQLNFIELGGLVCDLTENDRGQIKAFVALMIDSFYRGAESFSEEQLDKTDNGKLASILTTPSGKLQ